MQEAPESYVESYSGISVTLKSLLIDHARGSEKNKRPKADALLKGTRTKPVQQEILHFQPEISKFFRALLIPPSLYPSLLLSPFPPPYYTAIFILMVL
jgi:hypothetical protein